MSEFTIDQNVAFRHTVTGRHTGKVVGRDKHDPSRYIVLLDHPEPGGDKAVLIPDYALEPVVCHWCADTRTVPVTPLTMAQIESKNYPTKPCPYCTKPKYDSGHLPHQTPMSVSPDWLPDGNGFRQ
jgi:hypothetical protein